MTYTVPETILEKYAQVMINFALNEGEGVRPGQKVVLSIPESAKPFLKHLYTTVIRAGAHPIIRYHPDGLGRIIYEEGSEEHLDFFAKDLVRGIVDEMDCLVNVIADDNPRELEGIDPKKIMRRGVAQKQYREWLDEKENKGKFFWTLCLFGTPAMAQEAGLSLEEYWDEIATACYLYEDDPVEKWKEVQATLTEKREALTAMKLKTIRVVAENTDLTIGLGKERKWLGATARNIPSFELFISPDWRETRGHIQFTEKLYRYGNVIKDAYLEFDENGCVSKATASEGEDVLKEMIATEGADKVGEFSMTDKRFSKITRFMATTLYDENVGKEHGNTHIALGNAYKESYTGDVANTSKEEWKELGFNESVVHTDIVATSPREIYGVTEAGEEILLYKDGMYQF